MGNPWVAIVGRRGDGRARVTADIVDRLRARGWRVGGFVQEPVWHGDDIAGWDAVDLYTGARCAVARTSPAPELCDWSFEPAALEQCREWARQAAFDVVVAEAGTLEAGGRGHRPMLDGVLEGSPGRVLLLGIRPHALAALGVQLPDPSAGLELPAEAHELDDFVEDVGRLVREARAPSGAIAVT